MEIQTSPDDPYSSIIEKRYLDYFRFNDDPEKTLRERKYALYDIDGNGVDELILGDYRKLGDPKASVKKETEFDMIIKEIYTIKDGKAENQYVPDWWTIVFGYDVLSNGLLRLNGGDRKYMYSRFVNGKLEYIEQFTPHEKEVIHVYQSDEKWKNDENTIEEYESLKKELEGNATVVELEWRPFVEYKPI